MPFIKYGQTVSCDLFYCDNYHHGLCTADEPIDELDPNEEYCSFLSFHGKEVENVGRGPATVYMVRVDDRDVEDAVEISGVDLEVIDPDGHIFVLMTKYAGRKFSTVVQVRDLDGLGFYPAVDGTVGWRSLDQITFLNEI